MKGLEQGQEFFSEGATYSAVPLVQAYYSTTNAALLFNYSIACNGKGRADPSHYTQHRVLELIKQSVATTKSENMRPKATLQ